MNATTLANIIKHDIHERIILEEAKAEKNEAVINALWAVLTDITKREIAASNAR